MTDLLPCPFCGSESEVEEVGLGSTDTVSFTVGCASKHEDSCMGYQCFQTFTLRKDAIAAWNKRAPQPQTTHEAEQIEWLRSEVRRISKLYEEEVLKNSRLSGVRP